MTSFAFSAWFWLEVCFAGDEYICSCLLSDSIFIQNYFPTFYFVSMSLLMMWVSCRQQIFGSCFLIQSVGLHLLIGELRLFTFRILLKGICYFLSFCCFLPVFLNNICWLYHLRDLMVDWINHVWFIPNSHLLFYSSNEIYTFSSSHDCAYLAEYRILLSILSLVVMHFFSLCFSCKVFLLSLILKDNFGGSSCLSWSYFLFETHHSMLYQPLRVSEKSVIMGLSLFVTQYIFEKF